MKKAFRWALCLGLCLTLLVCVALADETPAIKVQLDGQDLAFTDAVPQVKDQRTFLPFRAVLEAMDAEVSNEGDVITAVRGGKTLTMTLGQTAATVTEDGKTTPITMDVAPYVDSATWRTYVPVRFAAQAFGCSVGWDQTAQTAIVIDLDKLLAQASEGKSYTYVEKLAAMDTKYNEGIWDMDATFDADVSMMGSPFMALDGAVKGTTEGEDKVDMDMNMKMDMTKYMDMMAQMSGQSVPAEAKVQLDALKTQGVDVSVRGDMTTGKLYMNLDMGSLATEAGLDPDTWYLLDMASLMKLSGMDTDWTELMDQVKDIDMLDLLRTVLVPDDAANDYAYLKKAVEDIATTLADESFVEKDGKYVSTYTLNTGDDPEDDVYLDFSLSLDLNGETLKGYTMDLGIAQPQDTSSGIALAMDDALGMKISISMNDKDEMTAEMIMGMGALMSMDMSMEGKYAPGATAPVVTPPEGATVVDYMEMLQSMMGTNDPDLGIIGGADGPTVIQVSGTH